MDYLKESFTSQSGIVKLVLVFALFVVFVPKYGLAKLNLCAKGMEPDMMSVLCHGAVVAVLCGLLCAGWSWLKEKHLEKDE